jgi:uncharacterized OB-fold protein
MDVLTCRDRRDKWILDRLKKGQNQTHECLSCGKLISPNYKYCWQCLPADEKAAIHESMGYWRKRIRQ